MSVLHHMTGVRLAGDRHVMVPFRRRARLRLVHQVEQELTVLAKRSICWRRLGKRQQAGRIARLTALVHRQLASLRCRLRLVGGYAGRGWKMRRTVVVLSKAQAVGA